MNLHVKKYSAAISAVGAVLLLAGFLSLVLRSGDSSLPFYVAGLGIACLVPAVLIDADLFRRYGRWLNAFWGTAMVLAIVGMLNFLGQRYSERIDLTEGQLHSLADLTVQTLEGLDRDAQALAFMEGGAHPELRSLLEQYVVHGGGRFGFEFIDPDRDPTRADAYGITAYNTLVIEVDGRRQNETELTEKEITNRLLKVVRDRQEVVYVAVGHGEVPLTGQEGGALGRMRQRLQEIDYVVRDSLFLAREGRVPDDCRVLIIAGPQSPLLPMEAEAVSNFLDDGGAVLLLTDPGAITGMESLVERWGVILGDDFVIDTSGIGSLFGLDFTIPVATQYDDGHPITRKHRSGTVTSYEFVRSVQLDSQAVATTQMEAAALVFTSDQSWGEVDLEALRPGRGEVSVSFDEADLPGPVSLAVAVRDSARAGGRLVVFGDSDFATDGYFDLQGNGDLLLNAISWLAEDEQLIAIRPRDPGFRPIALNESQSEWVFWLTVVLLPGVVAALGFFVVSRGGRWSLRDLVTAAVGVALSLGVVALLNVIGDRYHKRFDVTQDNLFTLSSQSQDVLTQLDQSGKRATLRVFMNEQEGGRYQELLREFEYGSDAFDFEVIDPQKEALQVQQYGIRDRGSSILEVSGGGQLASERFSEQTEQALSNALLRAMGAGERRLRYTTGHAETDLTQVDGEGFSILSGRLKELNVEISPIASITELGEGDTADGQVLALLGPQSALSAAEQVALRRYLERGGDLLLLVDPGVVLGIEDLLAEGYGIDLGDDFIVDLSGLGQLLGTDVSVPVVISYADHPVTEQMGRSGMSYFPLARTVTSSPGAMGVTELAFTDQRAWGESDLSPLFSSDGGGAVEYNADRDRPGPLSLAVAVSAQGDSAAGENLTRIVVIGDSDFARNQHFSQQGNGELLVHAGRWLIEGEDALSIAERMPRFNPLMLEDEASDWILWLSVFLLPFAVALSGFVIMLRRGYETYASGFVAWLVYTFGAAGLFYFWVGVVGATEGGLIRTPVGLGLSLLSGAIAYGLYRRSTLSWPVALSTAIGNVGLAFVLVPNDVLQLVAAGIFVANACILIWIRHDFLPSDHDGMPGGQSTSAPVNPEK
ncbi:MAG: GldG family protein [Gemmatimonadetes bacterium]|nr:GldG family protein [Gemmatimonadota bacterium]